MCFDLLGYVMATLDDIYRLCICPRDDVVFL